MGKYEVTQGQWQRLMGAFMQPQNKGAGEDFPVYWVSYIEAEEFYRKLTEQAHASNYVVMKLCEKGVLNLDTPLIAKGFLFRRRRNNFVLYVAHDGLLR